MEEPKERKTTTAKSPNAVPGPSLFSSLHPNPVYSSHLPSTPASRPTRATYAPPSASSTTPSPYPPTRLRRSSAPSARAPAFTSPLSCRPPRPPQPAGRACRLPRHPSLQHGACCAPVSSSRLCTKLWIHICPTYMYDSYITHDHVTEGFFVLLLLQTAATSHHQSSLL